ncbi:peptidase S58 [Gemmatimonadetes bacterium T265]|nr:peptidase S58 [Gemmatimonadetes bacterium T265]
MRAPTVDLAPFGLALGHAADAAGATGCTVVRGVDRALRAAAVVVGRATGTREFAALAPEHRVGRADAVLLTGGSAYGLDAAAGVMRWMEARGRGFPVGGPDGRGVVPIVPAAVLFDLAPLGRFDARPTPAMAYAACDAASPLVTEQGSVGAGTGATVGKALGAGAAMKGGIGCATAGTGELRAAAVAVVNAFGDVRDASGAIVAGARSADGGFVDTAALLAGGGVRTFAAGAATNTTLCVVALIAPVDRGALAQVASAATAALARRVTPSGTSFDGDVVFALCPDAPAAAAEPAFLLRAEALATAALEAAVENAVRYAVGREGVPGLAG